MLREAVSIVILAGTLAGCHTAQTARIGQPAPVYQPPPPVYQPPQPVYQPPPPVYQPAPVYQPPPGQGGVPPGHGGVPPGLAKKGGVPPGLAKKGYYPVGWNYGAPPWYTHNHYGVGAGYVPPYGVDRRTCYRERLGSALGALAGGVTGYQIGSGQGKTAAVIGGTIIGALIGGHIGRSMDQVDQNCIGQILEHAPPNQPVTWQDGGGQYQVTPSPAFQNQQGRYCREYQTNAMIGGQAQQTYGTACRQPDGSWQMMN